MIVAGFGFRKSASVGSLRNAYDRARADAHPDLLAAPDDKITVKAFRLFADEVGRPVRGVPADVLEQQSTVTQSLASLVERNIGSVAEAAALAAAGPGAKLLTERHISADKLATCALAMRETT
ncbi:cobalamin biosynthesis protein [Roseobacter sp. YSTF-M11]|uniref:Cobalamin biosynthesis protein n=1 Tax=Roseobacter insulae TaxID=2859783 RepID=A0A9X1FWZ8_9RHOB|nr:cobalamin biosynthesis protein [Roseobacter insulae]MBW4709106.1 cobalamin biosynthesis protein [Roseobacter insulae]